MGSKTKFCVDIIASVFLAILDFFGFGMRTLK